jgi:hypothetical protein
MQKSSLERSGSDIIRPSHNLQPDLESPLISPLDKEAKLMLAGYQQRKFGQSGVFEKKATS